jgi:hypothetical protein
MAKQTINIGTSANDGTGDPLRTAMDKTNDNFTELYNGAGGVADGAVTTAKLAADAVDGTKISDDSVNSEHYVDGSIDTVHIADDQITYAKLADEFTEIQALSGTTINWDQATVFTKTVTATESFTFSNAKTGMVIDLVLTGGAGVTLPASVKQITGTYDGTVSNLIQIVSTNDNTEQWATISQEATS